MRRSHWDGPLSGSYSLTDQHRLMYHPDHEDDDARSDPGGALVPRAIGRDAAGDRAAAGLGRAVRVRADGPAWRGPVAAVVPSQDAEDGRDRHRPEGGAMGL